MAKYKVEIPGINIHGKRLSHNETIALIDKYHETKDEKMKEKLVEDNTRLVLSMTKRFYQRTDNMDDLFQVGMIGLMKAIENFNTSYNLRFSTYAVPLIIGEMKRYLRDNSQIKISRTIRDLAYKVLQVKEKYMQEYKREPTIKELSKELDVDKGAIIEAMQSTNSISSLQEEVKNDDGNALTMIDQIPNTKENVKDINVSIDLQDALHHLTEKERKVIDDRYFYGRSQMEIANDLFISQAQVSRIEKQALANLHKYLK